MPRDASGTYTLPAGNPVITNTIISSVWANNTLSDIASALTDSLSAPLLSGNGLVARISSSSFIQRTLTGTSGQITVTNGDGVSGNPTLSLAAEVYKRDNIIGTVSQSAGVPTGAIFQTVSNSNGVAVKYADGTMISTHTITSSLAIGTAFSGGFRSTGLTWTFPVAYIAAPKVQACVEGLTAFGVCGGTAPTTTVSDFAFTSVTSAGAGTRTATVYAIGRWF